MLQKGSFNPFLILSKKKRGGIGLEGLTIFINST